jgi:biopolymer transport protein ExbB
MRRETRLWVVAATVATAGVLLARAALAQDADAAPPPVTRSLFDLFLAGGWIGHVIVLCSVAGVAVALQNHVQLRAERLCPPEVVVDLDDLLEAGRFDEAVARCEDQRCYLTSVLRSAASRAGEGHAKMLEGMQAGLDREHTKLLQKVATLSLLGNIGPMLGLTGTVTGMISSFAVIENVPVPSPALLARGIYEALVTTAEGLFLAIPILTVYFLLRNRVQILALDAAEVAEALVEKMRPMAGEAR